MSKIFVPVIQNDNTELFELSVTERNDPRTKNYKLILNNEPHPRYVDVITSKYTDLSHNVNLINPSMEFDVFTNATYSARLGIYLALQQKINNRMFLKNWDALVITGNLNKENNNLEEISEIEKKYEAVLRYAKEFSNNCLFVYVSNKEIKLEENPNIEIVRFSTSQTIKMLEAELFEPIFDEEQRRTLNAIFEIDQTHPYFPPQEFYELKQEALDTNWNGCCICGDSNSGKSVFVFHLCKYLMSVNKIYKPLWITLENTEYMLYKYKNENPLFLYLKKYFGDEEISFEKIKNFLLKNNYLIIVDTKNLVYDSMLNFIIINFFEKIKIKNPIIVTAIKQTDDLENFYLKSYLISNIDKKNCEKIFNYALKERNIIISKNDIDYDSLKNLIYTNCCSIPGNIYILARVLKIETIKSLVKRLEMHNVEEIESKYISTIISNLPEEEKIILWDLVREYKSKDLLDLKLTMLSNPNNEEKIKNSKKDGYLILNSRSPLFDKFYDLGLIKLKFDNEWYILFEKKMYLYLLKNEEMYDKYKYKWWGDKKIGMLVFLQKTLVGELSVIYEYCYTFIIYKQYHSFLQFLKRAIKCGANYYHLVLFARLMIIYEWKDEYIFEYLKYLKKTKFDVASIMIDKFFDISLWDFFKQNSRKSLLISIYDITDKGDDYRNLSDKQYKKRFRIDDDKGYSLVDKLLIKILLKILNREVKKGNFTEDDVSRLDSLKLVSYQILGISEDM